MWDKIVIWVMVLLLQAGVAAAQAWEQWKLSADSLLVDNDSIEPMSSLQIPVVELEEPEIDNELDGVNLQSISSVLTAGRDPFLNTAAFVFGQYRFQLRGYNRRHQQVFVNGALMDDLRSGNAMWSHWGGLNDMFRIRNGTYGLNHSEDGFGGLNGLNAFDASAISMPRNTRITYSLSNRQYRHRLMISHASGLQPSGWAYAISMSRRYAKQGYQMGTFYDGYSFFGSVSRKMAHHQLSLTAMVAPTKRGKAGAATEEVYELAGDTRYNANWGMQQGVIRNARIGNQSFPHIILNHQFQRNQSFKIRNSISMQTGKSMDSGLDWYKASDPRPDYYRYLPSWQSRNDDEEAAALIKSKWMTDPLAQGQINWARLYEVNQTNLETVADAEGMEGKELVGVRSVYVIANDVAEIDRFAFNSILERSLGERFIISGGGSVILQKTHQYKQLEDLLGGSFFLNLNQFAEQQHLPDRKYQQYDLQAPDRLIREGDQYQYNYILHQLRWSGWLQGVLLLKKWDFFVAAELGREQYSREGLYQHGLFPDHSLGMSAPFKAPITRMKAGATWKITGKHYWFLNGSTGTEVLRPDQQFISLRSRNHQVDNAETPQYRSVEAGYLLKAPAHKIRLVAYLTDFAGYTEIRRFYNDDPEFRSFVNYVITDLRYNHSGLELAINSDISSQISITAVAALGQTLYAANPSVRIYRDNDTATEARGREVYIKNYRMATGPQNAYSLGVFYRSKKYWYGSLNVNYFDKNFVSINPERRTSAAVGLLDPESVEYQSIVQQEQLPPFFTVNLFVGKSFLLSRIIKQLPRNTFLYFNIGVNNLLNNRNMLTGGFEQLRYDFAEKDPSKFPAKYFYGQGINYFINISLKY